VIAENKKKNEKKKEENLKKTLKFLLTGLPLK